LLCSALDAGLVYPLLNPISNRFAEITGGSINILVRRWVGVLGGRGTRRRVAALDCGCHHVVAHLIR
jgi:hypothetical protein